MERNPPRGNDPNGSHMGAHTPNNYPRPPTERNYKKSERNAENFGATQRAREYIFAPPEDVQAILDEIIIRLNKEGMTEAVLVDGEKLYEPPAPTERHLATPSERSVVQRFQKNFEAAEYGRAVTLNDGLTLDEVMNALPYDPDQPSRLIDWRGDSPGHILTLQQRKDIHDRYTAKQTRPRMSMGQSSWPRR